MSDDNKEKMRCDTFINMTYEEAKAIEESVVFGHNDKYNKINLTYSKEYRYIYISNDHLCINSKPKSSMMDSMISYANFLEEIFQYLDSKGEKFILSLALNQSSYSGGTIYTEVLEEAFLKLLNNKDTCTIVEKYFQVTKF